MRWICFWTTVCRLAWAICAFHSTRDPCDGSKSDRHCTLVCSCTDLEALRRTRSAPEAAPDDRAEGRTHPPLIGGCDGPGFSKGEGGMREIDAGRSLPPAVATETIRARSTLMV